MSDDQDDPVFNEPVATGQIQTMLAGNIDHAKTYIREARRMVGQMRINHGVNDRVARGEPGGFFRATRRLEDGTRIEVITNNNRDLIRIATPREYGKHESTHWTHSEDQRPSLKPSHHKATPDPKHTQVNPTTTRKVVREEEEEDPVEEYPEPYMWVGIRIKQPEAQKMPRDASMPIDSILTYMVEPAAKDTPRGCVVPSFYNPWWYYNECDLDQRVEPPEAHSMYESVSSCVAGFTDYYASVSPLAATCHNLMFTDISDSGDNASFFHSANGLRAYHRFGRTAYNTDMTPTENCAEFHPYDPSLPPDDQSGLSEEPPAREYNMPVYFPVYDDRIPNDVTAWEIVYVLDPKEGEQIEPCDPRERNALARRALEAAGMVNQVLPGNYVLHIGAVGDNGYQSVRAGDRKGYGSTGTWGGLSTDYFWPGDSSDMGEYLYIPMEPMQLEIEVRLGKEPDTQIFNYEITVPNYAELYKNTWPGGDTQVGYYSGCPYTGPNPYGSNWGGSIIIDVMNSTSYLGFEDDAGVFAPGGSTGEPDYRLQGMDLYLYTGVGASLTHPDNDLAYSAGVAVYNWMLQATTGYWGYSIAMSETTPDAIAEQLRAHNYAEPGAADIFKYDPNTHTVTPLPRIPITDDDRPPGYVREEGLNSPEPTPDGWVWFATLEWFYPYSYISKANCRVPYWMVMVGPQSGTGMFPQYGDPEMGLSCC